MKTFLCAMFSALLLAVAANGQTLTVENRTASCGQAVEVPVAIDSVTGMLALEFDVSYSSGALTFEGADKGTLTANFSLFPHASNGKVRVAMASGAPVSGSGTVAVLKFKLSATATGSLPLTPSGILVNDVQKNGNAGAIAASCTGGGGGGEPPAGAHTVTAGNVSASCGATFDVPIAIAPGGMRALEFQVAYNAASLTLVSAATTSLTSAFQLEKDSSVAGIVKVVMASGTPIAGAGDVAVLKFTLSGSASGALPLTLSNLRVNDAIATRVNGTITASCANGGGSPPTSAPAYQAPVNDARNVAAPVVLRWGGVNGATFRVYLGTTDPPPVLNTTDRTSLNVITQPGTTYYWRVDALTTGGGLAGPVWQFTTAGTNCASPSVAHLNGPPADVTAGNAFSLTWTASPGSTEYVLEESADASFASPGSSTHYGLSATFTLWHSVTTTKFYRVRGRNAAAPCSVNGPVSNVVTVRILPGSAGGGSPRMLAVAGSLPGSAGSYFRTAMQLHNHTGGMMRGRVVFHRQGSSGSNADPAFSYDLAPGVTRSWSDVVLAFGTGTGIGSIDLVPYEGEVPLTVARIYNDGGSNGTTGVVIDAIGSAEALQSGQRGQLIGPIDPARARMNLGIRTLDSGATIDFVLRDYSGTVRQTTRRSFAGTWFEQIAVGALFNTTLVGDEVIVVEIAAGSAIVYGSITDNVTQDPAVQFAKAR